MLVVITIIALLLALLIPALDKAIYQAEMAVCASKLKAIGTVATTYAAQFKRFYPVRVSPMWPNQICRDTSDDRPLLRQYMSLNKTLRCPLSGNWDLENYHLDAQGRMEMTYSSYLMWFNFRYTSAVPARPIGAMRKLGDKLVYGQDQFSILAHDLDVVDTTAVRTFTAHQDDKLVGQPRTLQNEPYPDNAGAGGNFANYSSWWWTSPTGVKRGLVDNNYAYDDGSVRRINGVMFIQGSDAAAADKAGMAMLPLQTNNGFASQILVPTR